MAVTTVSRGTLAGGRELAERLAKTLGRTCVSREDLTAEAARRGVPVAQLQAAMARPPRVYGYLGNERGQYLACMTMLLCEHILREDIVYYGHAAQMLLCGVPNVLRVRVLAHPEFRIASVIHKLGLGREDAKRHIEQVDTEREKWVRFLYGVDWNDPALYDIVVHIDQMGLNKRRRRGGARSAPRFSTHRGVRPGVEGSPPERSGAFRSGDRSPHQRRRYPGVGR
jgi:cytidylate kinase